MDVAVVVTSVVEIVVMENFGGMLRHVLGDEADPVCVVAFHDVSEVAFRSNQRLQGKQKHHQDE